MGSLWATNDVHTQERANRAAIASRYALPLYDRDDAGAIRVTPTLAGGTIGTGSGTTIYTVPAGVIAAVQALTFSNISGTPVSLNLHLIGSGVSGSFSNAIWLDTLSPGEVVTIQTPYHLAAGDRIAGVVSQATSVGVLVSLLHYAAQPAGLRLVVLQGVLLTVGAGQTLYTCPGDAVQAIVLSQTYCNSAPVAQPMNVVLAELVNIFPDVLQPKETVILEERHTLAPGQRLHSHTQASGTVSARITVVEVL